MGYTVYIQDNVMLLQVVIGLLIKLFKIIIIIHVNHCEVGDGEYLRFSCSVLIGFFAIDSVRFKLN